MSGERGAADHPAADERADRDALIAMQNWDAAEDDARPAAEAGRADEDVYAGPIRAMLAPYSDGIGTLSYERMFAAYHAAGDYRRLIDAARAPLLAELAEAREVYEAAKHAGNARAAQLVWQRDGETARAAAAENQLAEVTRERDEARAKAVDGGEWKTEYGCEHEQHRIWRPGPPRGAKVQRRVWYGPTGPVTDDGSGT